MKPDSNMTNNVTPEAGRTAGLCETCAHWSFEERDWEYDDLRFGTCKAIRQREDIDSDAVAGLEDRWGDEAEVAKKAALKASKAIAVDGSGYYAAVRTAPDFGCVLHALKSQGADDGR